MPLISITNASKSFGSNLIFSNVTMQIDARDKIGVIGPNGSGKTTLFRCLLGHEVPEVGEIARARDLKLGHLEQHNVFNGEFSVLDEVLHGREDLLAIERELAEIDDKLEHETDTKGLDRLIHRQAQLMEDFERGDGYSLRSRAEATLAGLGVDERFFDRKPDSLSGGEAGRVALARLLVTRPDVLFLDEPTNHLDLDGVLWLEEYLNRSKSTCCIISHDRYFLDRVTTRTVEVDRGTVTIWPGNFSKYEALKVAANRTAKKDYAEQQDYIRRERDFIAKHIGSQRTKEAKGRQRRLERLVRLVPPRDPSRDMTLQMTLARSPGVDMLEIEGLSVGHDGQSLFTGLDMRIDRGDRVGIIGPNGSGKTTLLNVLLGELEPMAGTVRQGSTVDIGYFDQKQQNLDPRATPFEVIAGVDLKRNDEEVRSWLARFLFFDDSIEREVSLLSGGEKSRLILARLILMGPNVLVLDEPTNHLDIPSRSALEKALIEYPGTLITVSHDRFFLDRIATRIIALGTATPRVFLGNYTDATERLEAARLEKEASKTTQRGARKKKPAPGRKKPRNGKKPRALETVEKDLMQAEESRATLLESMADPEVYGDAPKIAACKAELKRIDQQVLLLEQEWDELT